MNTSIAALLAESCMIPVLTNVMVKLNLVNNLAANWTSHCQLVILNLGPFLNFDCLNFLFAIEPTNLGNLALTQRARAFSLDPLIDADKAIHMLARVDISLHFGSHVLEADGTRLTLLFLRQLD